MRGPSISPSPTLVGAGQDSTLLYPTISNVGLAGAPSFTATQVIVIAAGSVTQREEKDISHPRIYPCHHESRNSAACSMRHAMVLLGDSFDKLQPSASQ